MLKIYEVHFDDTPPCPAVIYEKVKEITGLDIVLDARQSEFLHPLFGTDGNDTSQSRTAHPCNRTTAGCYTRCQKYSDQEDEKTDAGFHQKAGTEWQLSKPFPVCSVKM